MPALIYPITIEQGATWLFSMVWKDGDGEPIDITGYSAGLRIRPFHSSTTILLWLTSEPGGGIVLGGVAGSIDIEATDEQTAAITGERGVYTLNLISETGEVLRMLQGPVTISPGC